MAEPTAHPREANAEDSADAADAEARATNGT